jgi:hypothetical protein
LLATNVATRKRNHNFKPLNDATRPRRGVTSEEGSANDISFPAFWFFVLFCFGVVNAFFFFGLSRGEAVYLVMSESAKPPQEGNLAATPVRNLWPFRSEETKRKKSISYRAFFVLFFVFFYL